MTEQFWDAYLQPKVDAQAKFSTLDPALKPDGAARSFQLQGFSGVPAETIGPDPKEFDDQYQNKLRQDLTASNPHLTDFVNAHPLHAQLIKDDLSNLDRLTTTARQIALRQSTEDRAKQFAQDFKSKNLGWSDVPDALLEGMFHFGQSMRRAGSVISGGRGAEQVQQTPYAQPYEWGDLSNLGSAFAKTAYRMSNAFPSFTVGLGVTALTENPLAGVVAGGLSVGVLSGIQSIGDEFQKELAKTPEDPEGAYNRALVSAGTQGAFSGVGWGLFPVRFLNGPIKSVLFQIFGVQPAVGAAARITQGYQQGIQPGLGEGYVEDVVGSMLPLLLFEGVRGGRYALRPGTPFRPYTEGGPGFEITPPGGPEPRPQPSALLEPAATEGLVLPEGSTDMSRRGFLQGVGALAARTALPKLPGEKIPFGWDKVTPGWEQLVGSVHPAALDFAEEFLVDWKGNAYQQSWDKNWIIRQLKGMADYYEAQPNWDPYGLWSMHNMDREDIVQAHRDAAKLVDAGYDVLQARARALARIADSQTNANLWQPQDEQRVLVEGQQADENKKILDAAVKDAEKSQLKVLAPDKLNELMSQLPSQNLRIRAEALAKLYNELVKEPNRYIQGLIQKLDRSQGMLSSIQTDSTSYITNIPPDVHKALSDHIALGNDMAPSEVKEFEGIGREPPQEHVFLPAIQVKGQMFEDHDHAGAYDKAIKALQGVEINPEEVEEGYSTTNGRFITPQEALRIAQEQGQLRENAISTDSLAPGDLHVVGAKAQALQIGRDIRDQLIFTYSLDEKLAKDYGDLIASYYYRRAIDTGMSPDFLFESDGISFRWGDGDSTTMIGVPPQQPERPNLSIVQNVLEETPEISSMTLTRFGDMLKEAGFPILDADTIRQQMEERKDTLYEMIQALLQHHMERGTATSFEAIEFMKRIGLSVNLITGREKEFDDILVRAMEPYSRIERLWYNYARQMTPQEFLESEALLGTVRNVVEQTGAPENVVFAETANRIFQRMGLDRIMTPMQARIELARQKGIRLLQPILTGMRGQITIDDHLALIELFRQQFTVDTLAHEFYHLWVYNVFRDAQRPGASVKSVELRDDLLEWLHHPRGSIVDPAMLSEGDHELAADGGLNYLREGKAPSLQLARIFENFRDSLTNIYKDASSLGLPLNDSIRNFFNRIVATDEEIRRVTEPERATLDVIRHSAALDTAPILPDLPYQQGLILEGMLKNPATTWEQFATNPLIQQWLDTRNSAIPTGTIRQALDSNWRARRTYVLDGKEYGGDNIIPILLNKTAEAAGGPTAIRQEKTMIIIVGPPGAGKSTFQNPIAREFGARIIDVDDVRTVIPEYKGGQGLFATLMEGHGLTIEVLSRALNRGDNIIHPITGADPETSVENILNRLGDRGYTIKVLHIWAEPDVLVRRIVSRFIETGRIVQLEYTVRAASNTPLTYERLKSYADEAASIDTTRATKGTPPEITDGGDTTLADIIRRGSGADTGGDVSRILPEGPAGEASPTQRPGSPGVGPRRLRQDNTAYLADIQKRIEKQSRTIRQVLIAQFPKVSHQTIEYYAKRFEAGFATDDIGSLWRFILIGMPPGTRENVSKEAPRELTTAFAKIQFLQEEARRIQLQSGPRTLQQPPLPPESPTPPAEGEGGTPLPPVPPSPPFASGAAFGRTQAMYQQYLRMIRQRDLEDVVWRRNRAQRLAEKLNSQEWRDTVERLTPGIRTEVENLPEVAAFQAFTKREAKIARGSLTTEQAAMLPRTWIANEGIAIDDLANYYGYDLGEELVNVLAAMRRATEGFTGNIVTRMTKARVYQQAMEDLGETMQSRLDEVEDHALSLTQMEMLHERMLALGMQSGGALPLSKSASDWAIFEGFQASDFRNLKADRFLREAGRAGRALEQALLRNSPLDAFRAAQMQYVSTQMAKLAKTVEREIKAFGKVAKRFRSREVSGIDVRFTNFIHDILMRTSAGQVNRSVQDLQNEIAQQHGDDEQTLHGFLAKQQAEGNYIPVPDFLLDPAWTGDIQSLDVRSARQVMNAIRALAKVGRDLDRVVVAGERRDVNEVVDSLTAQLGTLGPGVTRARFRSSTLHQILAAHLQMESLFNRWAYGRAFGEFNQVLRPMIEAANEEAALDKETAEAYRNLPDKLKSWELNASVSNNLFKNPIEAWEPTGGPNGTFNWNKPGIAFLPLTKKNARAILLNAGNPDNLQRFAAGFGLQQQQVMDWLFRNTTKEDWDWAQAHGKIFAKLKTESDSMYRRLNGVAPEAIPIYPIQTPFGIYEGWYHPVIHDEHFYGRWQEQQGVAGLFAKEYTRAATAQGYTKSRTGYRGPLSIELDAVPGRFWQEIHDISFREAVMNTAKIFYNTRFRNQVMRQYGKEYSDHLIPWLEDVANTMARNTVAQKSFAIGMGFLRENLMGTLIGFNPRTVQKHFTTAAANSIAEVGAKDMLEATVSLLGSEPGRQLSNWNFALSNSLELQRRHQSFLEHVSGAQSSALGQRSGVLQGIFGPVIGFNLEQFRKRMLHAGTTPVAISDLISAVPVWLAAYKQIMEGRNEEYNKFISDKGITGPRPGDAVYFADRAVRRAHGSTAVTNRPWVMREGFGGELGKLLATFYSFFNHMANRQYELAWRARVAAGQSTDQEAIEAVKEGTNWWILLFAYVIAPAIVEELVTPMTNADKMSWGEWVAKSLALGLSASWVGVRDLVHSVLEGNDANLGLGGTLIKAPMQVYRDLNYKGYDPAHAGKTIKHFNTLIGVGTGLTNTEIGNMMEYIRDLNKGVAKPQNSGDWWRGLTKGEQHPREDRPDMVERFLRAIGKDRSWK